MTIFLFAPWELQIHRMLTKLHAGYMMCEKSLACNFFERFTSLSEIGFFPPLSLRSHSLQTVHISSSLLSFIHPTAFSLRRLQFTRYVRKKYIKTSNSRVFSSWHFLFRLAFLSFVIFLRLPTRSFIYCDVFLRRSPPESTRYVRIMRWFMTSRL